MLCCCITTWHKRDVQPQVLRRTETATWPAAVDIITKRRFDPVSLEFDFCRDKDDAHSAEMFNDNVLQEYINSRRLSCETRLRLSRAILDLLTVGQFEDKWRCPEKNMCLEHSRNWKMILPGSFYLGKVNCPEFIYAIEKKGFCTFFDCFCWKTTKISPEPFVLENARFDAILGWKGSDDVARHFWT